MKIIKNTLCKVLAAFGYEVRRLGSPPATAGYENFLNLTRAFETFPNDGDNPVKPNDVRPWLLGRLSGTPPSEAYFIIQALQRCNEIPGDICEFGVTQGETSALIANEIAQSAEKSLHLFDSFEGLPGPRTRTN